MDLGECEYKFREEEIQVHNFMYLKSFCGPPFGLQRCTLMRLELSKLNAMYFSNLKLWMSLFRRETAEGEFKTFTGWFWAVKRWDPYYHQGISCVYENRYVILAFVCINSSESRGSHPPHVILVQVFLDPVLAAVSWTGATAPLEGVSLFVAAV